MMAMGSSSLADLGSRATPQVNTPAEVANRVYPSGFELATASVPVSPPAPGRFTMLTGCFKTFATSPINERTQRSVDPPRPVRNNQLDLPFRVFSLRVTKGHYSYNDH